MKLIVKLIISIILISFTFERTVKYSTSLKEASLLKTGCLDHVCDRLCENVWYKGKKCNAGYCFETGMFCHCRYMKDNVQYECNNLKLHVSRKYKKLLLKKK